MQCTNYHGTARCDREAEVNMTGPDGERVPGCRFCLKCATDCVEEYAEKLGESWWYERMAGQKRSF